MKLDILVDIHDTIAWRLLIQIEPKRIGLKNRSHFGQHELEYRKTTTQSFSG